MFYSNSVSSSDSLVSSNGMVRRYWIGRGVKRKRAFVN